MPNPQALKRELGLRDLVLTQILFVVGLSNFGFAAKLGPSHAVVWLTAIVLFYIPLAMVVIHLNGWRPLEGGLYQWAHAAFGDLAGFLVAWNLWIYAMALMSELGITTVTNLSYALGPSTLWMAENKPILTGVTAFLVLSLAAVSILGLSVGKWIYNLGALTLLILLGALLAANFMPHTRATLSLKVPPPTLLNLNILGKLAFFALGGFEYVAVFAGECKDPARLIARSVWVSAPIIAALFIFGTSAVLAVVDPAQVDLVSPVLQAISVTVRPLGLAAGVASGFFAMLLISRLAQASINFAVNSRLPMVAGWDRLLPAWFTKLHPTRRTPVNSVFFVAAVTLALALAGIAGAGRQEAYQLLSNASEIFYGLAYLAMFAIPILGHASAPWWLRIASVSGFAMTLLCVVLSVFPIIDVPNPWVFTMKVGGTVAVLNAAGGLLYWLLHRGRMRKVLVGAAASACLMFGQTQVLKPKVVIVTYFEVGEDTGDQPGELQYWVERDGLNRKIEVPGMTRAVRANAAGTEIAVAVGPGNIKPAVNLMALGSDLRFDLRESHWLINGIAGISPKDGTIGSAVWTDFVVNGDLAKEVDPRETPAGWPDGFLSLDATDQAGAKGGAGQEEDVRQWGGSEVRSNKRGNVIRLNADLLKWAFELTRGIRLAEDEPMRTLRLRYGVRNGPHVQTGANMATEIFWHGSKMDAWAHRWVAFETDGVGRLGTTAMNDTGTLLALQALTAQGKADWNLALVLRTASNFDMPPAGVSAVENLASEKHGQYTAYLPALEAAYIVGHRVVAEWLK